MSTLHIRRVHTIIEDVRFDGGKAVVPPLQRVVVAAVIGNPFAGRYVDDLSDLFEFGEILSGELIERAKSVLAGDVVAYGKGGIVGVNGEIEHLAAILHPKFGEPIRASVQGEAILQSTKKRGAPGVTLDMPLSHKLNMRVRSHVDSMTVMVPDAPCPDEMVICLAVSNGPRAHHRVGGLAESDL